MFAIIFQVKYDVTQIFLLANLVFENKYTTITIGSSLTRHALNYHIFIRTKYGSEKLA